MRIRIALTLKILGLLCLAVGIGILSLGLWPFHTLPNAVTWLDGCTGLRFGPNGTAISSGLIRPPGPGPELGAGVEFWLQPRRIWDSGTFLAFYAPEHSFCLLLRQSQTDLEIQTWRTGPGGGAPAKLYVSDVFWHEFEMSRSYWSAVLNNIVGFIPFGCCFFAWLSALRLRRAALVTVLLGTAVSVTIEILQAYRPVRDSGTTDIITNMLGTWLGLAIYRLARPLVSGRFPWFSVVVSGLSSPTGD